jgi:hypothetical protein
MGISNDDKPWFPGHVLGLAITVEGEAEQTELIPGYSLN